MKKTIKKEPSAYPQYINDDTWYYEYKKYLYFVAWKRSECITLKVPLKMLAITLNRIGYKLKAKRKKVDSKLK